MLDHAFSREPGVGGHPDPDPLDRDRPRSAGPPGAPRACDRADRLGAARGDRRGADRGSQRRLEGSGLHAPGRRGPARPPGAGRSSLVGRRPDLRFGPDDRREGARALPLLPGRAHAAVRRPAGRASRPRRAVRSRSRPTMRCTPSTSSTCSSRPRLRAAQSIDAGCRHVSSRPGLDRRAPTATTAASTRRTTRASSTTTSTSRVSQDMTYAPVKDDALSATLPTIPQER